MRIEPFEPDPQKGNSMQKDSYQPLTPAVYHILLALADGEKHGYAIMKDVESQSSGSLKMGPGTLYGSIKRMLAAGLIAESGLRPDPALDDERRRYYRLSGLGEQVVAAESRRLATLVQVAQQKHVLTLLPAAEVSRG
jgi:DNA-binding PadR family transcriptional regulator